jgi:hypothetical protein
MAGVLLALVTSANKVGADKLHEKVGKDDRVESCIPQTIVDYHITMESIGAYDDPVILVCASTTTVVVYPDCSVSGSSQFIGCEVF